MPKVSASYFSKAFEILRHWDSLPDDCVVQTKVTALVTGLSERTVRITRNCQGTRFCATESASASATYANCSAEKPTLPENDSGLARQDMPTAIHARGRG